MLCSRRQSIRVILSTLVLGATALFPSTEVQARDCLGGIVAALQSLISRARPPSSYWANSPWIQLRSDGYVFRMLNRSGVSIVLPVVEWSRSGNPILRITPQEMWIVPTQGSIPRIHEYMKMGGDLEKITRRDPIFGEIQHFSSMGGPPVGRLVVSDGHHRMTQAIHRNVPVYVELGGMIDGPSRKVTSDSWQF